MLRTLEEIREAGARAVANFPPLTAQQVDIIAPLINPALAMTAPAAKPTCVPKADPLPLAA
jgi:hypothetical protein